MKKSKKQIPSIKFRKFAPGGTMNFDESTYNSSLPSTNGNIDYMNDKRTKGLSTAQYAQLGNSAMNAGLSIYNSQNNPNLTANQKQQAGAGAVNSVADSAIGMVPGFGQVYGMASGASKSVRGMLPTDEYGNIVGDGNKAINEIVTPDHEHMINNFSKGEYGAGVLDLMGIGKFGRMASQLTGNDQKTTGFWGKANDFMGIEPDKTKYAQGGMNMVPNSEVEKQENSVAPNGQFTQFNGPSHANGGVKTQLAPGEMVFSDRLKLGKKTFAQLNKSNNTNKEDKILEDSKSGNISTRTAALMKMAKLKSSEELFNIQEQLKQSKVENYAKKMGVSLPQMLPSNDQNQQYSYGGMNLPKFAWAGTFDEENPIGYKPKTIDELYKQQQLDKINNAGRYIPSTAQYNPEDDIIVPGTQQPSNFDPNTILDPKDQVTTPINLNGSKPSWWSNNKQTVGNTAGQVGMGLLQNAGNIYNLSRYNTPEIEKYQRVKASYLDPTAAIRDAEQENRRAEVDIRNATNGNAGNYLSNRVALSTKNALNKDRVRQQYANTNAGIANQNSQVNADISMREIIANAQNRARTRSGKEEAISQIGSNIANQFLDSKKGKMDQDTLQLMMKYYDNPEFQKAMKESNFNKQSKKAGK